MCTLGMALSEIRSLCDSDKVGHVTFCKIGKEMARHGSMCLYSQRSGEDQQDVSSKTAKLRHQGPASETRDGGLERWREGQGGSYEIEF